MSKSFREKAEAKRTSAGNPALMFISQPGEQDQKADDQEELIGGQLPSGATLPKMTKKALAELETGIAERGEKLAEIVKDSSLKAKKASKKAGTATPKIRSAQAPRAAQGAEPKSRRLQLLIQPSLYEAVKARAAEEGTSVNDQISSLLRDALGI